MCGWYEPPMGGTAFPSRTPPIGPTRRVASLRSRRTGRSIRASAQPASVDAAPDPPTFARCQALAIQPDDRLLVAGGVGHGADASGLLVRLLRDGSADDTFSAPAVVAQMSQATALTFDPGGKLLVAGQGPSDVAGALVARLAGDGVLDATFGNAGTTWIDLPAFQPQVARVNDLAVGTDGSLTLAGSHGYSAPFAARLSGDGSADAAGVVSMTHPVIATIDGEAQAVVTVRRAGGKAGAVSVAWRTEPVDDSFPASPGIDYGEVTGQLTWDDGDMTDREIAIPVIPDTISGDRVDPGRLRIVLAEDRFAEGRRRARRAGHACPDRCGRGTGRSVQHLDGTAARRGRNH